MVHIKEKKIFLSQYLNILCLPMNKDLSVASK